jgi:hypothetical protein
MHTICACPRAPASAAYRPAQSPGFGPALCGRTGEGPRLPSRRGRSFVRTPMESSGRRVGVPHTELAEVARDPDNLRDWLDRRRTLEDGRCDEVTPVLDELRPDALATLAPGDRRRVCATDAVSIVARAGRSEDQAGRPCLPLRQRTGRCSCSACGVAARLGKRRFSGEGTLVTVPKARGEADCEGALSLTPRLKHGMGIEVDALRKTDLYWRTQAPRSGRYMALWDTYLHAATATGTHMRHLGLSFWGTAEEGDVPC